MAITFPHYLQPVPDKETGIAAVFPRLRTSEVLSQRPV
jgi:hypothetical protein